MKKLLLLQTCFVNLVLMGIVEAQRPVPMTSITEPSCPSGMVLLWAPNRQCEDLPLNAVCCPNRFSLSLNGAGQAGCCPLGYVGDGDNCVWERWAPKKAAPASSPQKQMTAQKVPSTAR